MLRACRARIGVHQLTFTHVDMSQVRRVNCALPAPTIISGPAPTGNSTSGAFNFTTIDGDQTF